MTCVAYAFLEEEQNSGRNKSKVRKRGILRNKLKVVKSHLGLWAWDSVKLELGS